MRRQDGVLDGDGSLGGVVDVRDEADVYARLGRLVNADGVVVAASLPNEIHASQCCLSADLWNPVQ